MADLSDMINPTPSEDDRANAIESYKSFSIRGDKIASFLHHLQTLQIPSFEYMMFICGAVGNSGKMQKKLFCFKDKKNHDDSYLTGGYIIFVKWLSYAVQSIEDDPFSSDRGRRVDAMAIASIIDLIRNCSVIKTVVQVEILITKFNVDWTDIVKKVHAFSERNNIDELITSCTKTQAHLDSIRGTVSKNANNTSKKTKMDNNSTAKNILTTAPSVPSKSKSSQASSSAEKQHGIDRKVDGKEGEDKKQLANFMNKMHATQAKKKAAAAAATAAKAAAEEDLKPKTIPKKSAASAKIPVKPSDADVICLDDESDNDNQMNGSATKYSLKGSAPKSYGMNDRDRTASTSAKSGYNKIPGKDRTSRTTGSASRSNDSSRVGTEGSSWGKTNGSWGGDSGWSTYSSAGWGQTHHNVRSWQRGKSQQVSGPPASVAHDSSKLAKRPRDEYSSYSDYKGSEEVKKKPRLSEDYTGTSLGNNLSKEYHDTPRRTQNNDKSMHDSKLPTQSPSNGSVRQYDTQNKTFTPNPNILNNQPSGIRSTLSSTSGGRGRGQTLPAWMTQKQKVDNLGDNGENIHASNGNAMREKSNDDKVMYKEPYKNDIAPLSVQPSSGVRDSLSGTGGGRGRGQTLPAWMTQKQKVDNLGGNSKNHYASNGAATIEKKSEMPTSNMSNQNRLPSPSTMPSSGIRDSLSGTGGGRGRGQTLPAWMTQKQKVDNLGGNGNDDKSIHAVSSSSSGRERVSYDHKQHDRGQSSRSSSYNNENLHSSSHRTDRSKDEYRSSGRRDSSHNSRSHERHEDSRSSRHDTHGSHSSKRYDDSYSSSNYHKPSSSHRDNDSRDHYSSSRHESRRNSHHDSIRDSDRSSSRHESSSRDHHESSRDSDRSSSRYDSKSYHSSSRDNDGDYYNSTSSRSDSRRHHSSSRHESEHQDEYSSSRRHSDRGYDTKGSRNQSSSRGYEVSERVSKTGSRGYDTSDRGEGSRGQSGYATSTTSRGYSEVSEPSSGHGTVGRGRGKNMTKPAWMAQDR